MLPNKNNFCGGNFQDWLEVMLISKCNGSCSWCVERYGYKPKRVASWTKIANTAIRTGKKNIILLGGEPTLYPNMGELVRFLVLHRKNVYITTNGSHLCRDYIQKNLLGITGINISIHDYFLPMNKHVTGILLEESVLVEAIETCKKNGISVRFNCNLIRGHVETKQDVFTYIKFAKERGANKIRFAELKNDVDLFVDLKQVLPDITELNDDPFLFGCNHDVVINDMPVNLRQMCGLQTLKRPKPIDSEQFSKQVLYYNGKIYNGWQITEKEKIVDDKTLIKLLEDVSNGKKSVAEAALIISRDTAINENEDSEVAPSYAADVNDRGCMY